MGLILEYEGKELFRKYGIPLNKFHIARSLDEAKNAGNEIGYPVVVKAQVLSGGRGKKGWIRLAKNSEELQQMYTAISTSTREAYGRDFPMLIEKAANIKQEFFISMLVDSNTLETVILFSTEGGIDIETLAKEKPAAIERFRIPYGTEVFPYHFMEGLGRRSLKGKIKLGVATIISILVEMMRKEDLQLAEINPLIITKEDDLAALDSRIFVDDDATYRHPERENYLSQALRYTKQEKEAKENGLSYVDLGGDIGTLSTGAGMGMTTADLIETFSNKKFYPRNFLDVGGGASPDKVEQALRIMTEVKGLKAIFINAFGGITRLDDVAKGIVEARRKYNITIPMVIRLTGTNQKEGLEILKSIGLEAFEDMEPAIQKVIQLASGAV